MPDASLTIDGVEVLKKTSGEINLTNTNFVPNSSFMFRNKIINGNFDIWQRGTSFTISNSTNTYSTDRWRFLGSAFTGTLTRENFSSGQTEVPNNPDYFAKWTVTTNPAGNMAFGQYIENVKTLAGETATLSLYLKSSSTISANSLQIRYRQVTGGTGGTNNAINIGEITTSWQKFTFQLNISSLAGETLGAPNNSYLSLEILSPTAHTSAFDLSIAQVQLEAGTVATPFEHRPIGMELSLAQRYFFKGNSSVGPEYLTNGGNIPFTSRTSFPVTMNHSPDMTNLGFTNVSNSQSPSFLDISADGFGFRTNMSNGLNVGTVRSTIVYSADAEL